tara:strand:- start:1209 stop:2630 length:1422 start_codon:yes stop_codon:yes gene_type:complete
MSINKIAAGAFVIAYSIYTGVLSKSDVTGITGCTSFVLSLLGIATIVPRSLPSKICMALAAIGSGAIVVFAGNSYDRNTDYTAQLTIWGTLGVACTITCLATVNATFDWTHLVTDDCKYQRLSNCVRLSLDYAFSASLMLCVVSLLWGSTGLAGVVVAPVALFTALQCSSYLLYQSVTSKFKHTDDKACVLIMLLTVYVAALVPFLLAAIEATSSTTIEPNEATAPPAVLIIAISFVILFTTFVVPYVLELFNYNTYTDPSTKQKLYYCTRTYMLHVVHCALSLIAKVVLHCAIILAAIRETQVLNQVSDDTTQPPSLDTETSVSISIGATIGVGILLVFVAVGFKCLVYQIHLVCFILHLATGIVALVLVDDNAYREMNSKFWIRDKWYYKCFNTVSQKYTTSVMCDDRNKAFFTESSTTATHTIHYMALATGYVFISAGCHLVLGLYEWKHKDAYANFTTPPEKLCPKKKN